MFHIQSIKKKKKDYPLQEWRIRITCLGCHVKPFIALTSQWSYFGFRFTVPSTISPRFSWGITQTSQPSLLLGVSNCSWRTWLTFQEKKYDDYSVLYQILSATKSRFSCLRAVPVIGGLKGTQDPFLTQSGFRGYVSTSQWEFKCLYYVVRWSFAAVFCFSFTWLSGDPLSPF